MPGQSPPLKSPLQRIILDTNVLSYLSEKETAPQILGYMLELVQRGFGFAISDITIYELLRGNKQEKEKRMIDLLNPYFRYFLTDTLLVTAAQLDNIMKLENIDINSVDHGDKFISATAILTGSLILTADAKGFHWPFFQEVERKIIYFTAKNKKTKCYILALLKPDNTIINQRFSERP